MSLITDYESEVQCSYYDIASGATPPQFSESNLNILHMNIQAGGTKLDEFLLYIFEFSQSGVGSKT